ncbi:hypothetical protein M407DRAFT_29306 [Tulasnella calospora MUT 4182]|uniref:Uncharacterized protein n=1 Tax=Tulasnella calospora MUT 4182 TaxID=1051891 RepID=A0A0C3PZN9_9AGAM|nr:hypothetical protein M407DRAFT_29306 [Tulasnella calospora MUT 4182]
MADFMPVLMTTLTAVTASLANNVQVSSAARMPQTPRLSRQVNAKVLSLAPERQNETIAFLHDL